MIKRNFLNFMRRAALVLPAVLFLSGCFESEFNFDTRIHSDASVERKTVIRGGGADLYKRPPSPPWQVKVAENPGEALIIPLKSVTITAEGRFRAGEPIPSDYELDISRQIGQWTEETRKKILAAGIEEPFEKNVFSKNEVRISQMSDFFSVTTFYEENFLNAGVISLLLIDLKREIVSQLASEVAGFKDDEIEELARLRLEDEILPALRFSSRVEMPGKIVSTNGKATGFSQAEWHFSVKDFEKGYSFYTLKAVSRTLKPEAFWILTGLGGALLFFLIAIGLAAFKQKKKRRGGGKEKPRP